MLADGDYDFVADMLGRRDSWQGRWVVGGIGVHGGVCRSVSPAEFRDCIVRRLSALGTQHCTHDTEAAHMAPSAVLAR